MPYESRKPKAAPLRIYGHMEKSSPPRLSVVIPAFNEEENIEPLVARLHEALDTGALSYEVLLVDDGSTDATTKIAQHLAHKDDRMRVITLPHGGKASALHAGFAAARGAIIATLDADLQDDPHELIGMCALIESGADLVCGWKYNRLDPYWGKIVPSKFFNFMVSSVSGVRLHDHNCGLKVYRAEVAKSLPLAGQLHRFIPMLANAVGYTAIMEVPVAHHRRLHGKTKYGASRFLYGVTGFVEALSVARTLRRAHTQALLAAQPQ
jgi:glycosyltransferase involved in cell wall biosynthesis